VSPVGLAPRAIVDIHSSELRNRWSWGVSRPHCGMQHSAAPRIGFQTELDHSGNLISSQLVELFFRFCHGMVVDP